MIEKFSDILRVDGRLATILGEYMPTSIQTAKPKRYAVYRAYYGEDFIRQSIESVRPYVDDVFVFWTDKAFADVAGIEWGGEWVAFPKPADRLPEIVAEMSADDPAIHMVYDHWGMPDGQWSHIVNDRLLAEYEHPELIICMEPDMVWKQGELEKALQTFIDSGELTATFPQVELWKHLTRRIPERPKRIGPVFFSMAGKYRNGIPETGKSANAKGMVHLNGAHVHNLGFCVHPRTMLLKHLLAIGFSAQIEDSPPNEQWLLDKWMAWDPVDNDKDLEISKGREHTIPNTQLYSRASLPEVLR